MTGGPGKEHRSNKRPPTVRTWERSKETPRVLPLPRLLLNALHFDWAMHVPPEYPESEWLARKNPETNLITIKPKIESHVVGQFSQVPLPFCSPLRRPFSKVSCFVSMCVSSDSSFMNVTQEPPFGLPLPATSGLNACPSGQSFCLFYWGTVDIQLYNSGSQFLSYIPFIKQMLKLYNKQLGLFYRKTGPFQSAFPLHSQITVAFLRKQAPLTVKARYSGSSPLRYRSYNVGCQMWSSKPLFHGRS